jgi:hypothetical protein
MGAVAQSMAEETDPPPVPQQLLDSEWLLALAALLFFVLSYVVWGLVDLTAIPAG